MIIIAKTIHYRCTSAPHSSLFLISHLFIFAYCIFSFLCYIHIFFSLWKWYCKLSLCLDFKRNKIIVWQQVLSVSFSQLTNTIVVSAAYFGCFLSPLSFLTVMILRFCDWLVFMSIIINQRVDTLKEPIRTHLLRIKTRRWREDKVACFLLVVLGLAVCCCFFFCLVKLSYVS